MRDDADHDAADDKRHGHKCDQHIGDDVDHTREGAGEQRDVVGVGDLLVVGAVGVVRFDAIGDAFLVFKGVGIDADGIWRVEADLAKFGEVVFVGDIARY